MAIPCLMDCDPGHDDAIRLLPSSATESRIREYIALGFLRRQPAQTRTLVPSTVLANLPGAIPSRLITREGRCLREAPSRLPEFGDYLQPTLAAAQVDRDRTIAEISEVALAQGGWSLLGACQILEDVVDEGCDNPNYLALQDATLDFLHTSECSEMCLNGHLARRWVVAHGSLETF